MNSHLCHKKVSDKLKISGFSWMHHRTEIVLQTPLKTLELNPECHNQNLEEKEYLRKREREQQKYCKGCRQNIFLKKQRPMMLKQENSR